jgi:hypothetical protein
MSERSFLTGNQSTRPTIRAKKKDAINEEAVGTSYSTAETINGKTIERLKTIISSPNVLKTDL